MATIRKEYILYLLKIAFVGVAFTAVAYNIDFPDFRFRYIAILVFYFLCTVLAKRPSSGNQLMNCLLIALPAIIIDVSVLITNQSLVPLRFPFSSVFPILGCLLGYLVIKRRFKFVTVLALAMVAFFIYSFT